jgi:hypothetical protein
VPRRARVPNPLRAGSSYLVQYRYVEKFWVSCPDQSTCSHPVVRSSVGASTPSAPAKSGRPVVESRPSLGRAAVRRLGGLKATRTVWPENLYILRAQIRGARRAGSGFRNPRGSTRSGCLLAQIGRLCPRAARGNALAHRGINAALVVGSRRTRLIANHPRTGSEAQLGLTEPCLDFSGSQATVGPPRREGICP